MNEQLLNSLENITVLVGIIIATVFIAFLIDRFFKHLIYRSTQEVKNDPTNYLFLRRAIVALIYIVGFSMAIYMMPTLRIFANSLLAGVGIMAVAIGFASQNALSNVISGVFIIIFKPFRVHDRVKLRDMMGVIEDVTLRHTVLRDFENKRIIIPNAIISDEIIVNSDFGDKRICSWIDVRISYNTDIDKAKKIIREEILNHSLLIDPRTPLQITAGDELAPVKVIGLGDSSVNIRGWAWTNDAADAFNMRWDLLESIKLRFDAVGIEIPFPHRTLVHKDLHAYIENQE